MKIDVSKQKYFPEFKRTRFKNATEFHRWLSMKAKYKIHFGDKSQDCTEWIIDAGGEVLHADLQSTVWNGMCVDLGALKVGKEIGVVMPEKQATQFYEFIVAKIEKV